MAEEIKIPWNLRIDRSKSGLDRDKANQGEQPQGPKRINPHDPEGWWRKMKEQGGSELFDIEAFDRDHPDISVPDGFTQRERWEMLDPNGRFNERLSGNIEGVDVDLIMVREKKEDAGGVTKAADGSIAMVVADGVSNNAYSKIASRVALEVALRGFATDQPSHEIHMQIEERLRSLNLAEATIEHLKQLGKEVDAGGNHSYKLYNVLRAYHEEGNYTSTTLTKVRYSKASGTLEDIDCYGNSPLYVLSSKGERKHTIIDDTPRQLMYRTDEKPPHEIPPRPPIKLDEGDIVLLCSDGINPHLAAIQNALAENSGKNPPDNESDVIAKIVHDQTTETAGDDITVIAIKHASGSQPEKQPWQWGQNQAA